jgi:hypothetical protein
MGGQACVLYGAAEFSRDLDLLVLSDPASLDQLQKALTLLDAESIAIPELEPQILDRGHAVHFRCRREDVQGLRIDIMSRLRGVDDFERLWLRRTTIVDGENEIDLLSLPDLVTAKKTQRDKDWPMIRRLVEQVYQDPSARGENALEFLFLELRTAELLITLAQEFTTTASRLAPRRPAIERALNGSEDDVAAAIVLEETIERSVDRAYWRPLRQELETIRRSRVKPKIELD